MKPAREHLPSLRFMLLVTLLNVCAYAVAQTETKPVPEGEQRITTLRGRILADLAVQFPGAGVGPKHQTFIFGVGQDDGRIQPIRIDYRYFGRNRLPSGLFDYTKEYELKAIRETSCDEAVGRLSLVKNVDSSGQELPPTYVLRLLDGVPNSLLKPEMILPCYSVGEGHVRPIPGG